MPKFFVEKEDVKNDLIELKEENANHIKNVLRLKVDDDITVCTKERKKLLLLYF